MPYETAKLSNFDETLETCRRFLLAVANEELPAGLRAKGGASDLVQQTLAAAIRSEHQFRGGTIGELRAWLRAILRSEAAAFRRRYAGTCSRDIGRESSVDPAAARDDRTPVSAALRAEEIRQLSAAVEQLPDGFRQAVILRMEDGLSFAEIGKQLGRSEEAARKLFTRALDQLRGRLSDLMDSPS